MLVNNLKVINLYNNDMIQDSDQDKKLSSSVLKLNYILKIGVSAHKWKKYSKNSQDRLMRLKELYNTEVDYASDLSKILTKIQVPLRELNAITEQQEKIIFSSLPSMIQLSQQMQLTLKAALDTWNQRKTLLGRQMVRFSKFMLVYSDYFKNLKATQRKINILLETNEKVKQIQKSLSTEKRIVTIQDMISKPFQRPLKYHLILRDYLSKTDKEHPDYKNLQQAINCYHLVNEKNNQAMQNKQKDQTLLLLDSKFHNIIEASSRYYVTQYECVRIDIACKLYIFSDLIILAKTQGNIQQEIQRIKLDETSFAECFPDGSFFVNKLFICGTKQCAYVTFQKRNDRNEASQILKKLIGSIYNNQSTRKEIIEAALSDNNRETLIQKRRSYTQLTPQILKPLQIRIVGHEKRPISRNKFQIFFIIEFRLSPPQNAFQYSYVQIEELLRLQKLVQSLYPKYNFPSIQTRPKGLSEWEANHNESKSLQFKTIFAQILLNMIFRDQNLLKRIDIFAFILKISEGLWFYSKNINKTCICTSCKQVLPTTIQEYLTDQLKRKNLKSQNVPKTIKAPSYCPIRTIKSQHQICNINPKNIGYLDLDSRLSWLKSKIGKIDFALTMNSFSTDKKYTIKLYYHKIEELNNFIPIEVFKNDRVRSILGFVKNRIDIALEDYALSVVYIDPQKGNRQYLLDDDQVLWDVINRKKEEEGVFSIFKNAFEGDPLRVRIYLKKLYVLEKEIELKSCALSLKEEGHNRINFIIQQIIYRLKHQQLTLSEVDTCMIYSQLYCYNNFFKLDLLSMNSFELGIGNFLKAMPPKYGSKKIVQNLWKNIEEIKSNKDYHSSTDIGLQIIALACQKPGWSAFLFEADLLPNKRYPKSIKVKIGSDIKYFYIQESGKSGWIQRWQLKAIQGKYWTNVFELTVYMDERYVLIGGNMQRVRQILDFYLIYVRSFEF